MACDTDPKPTQNCRLPYVTGHSDHGKLLKSYVTVCSYRNKRSIYSVLIRQGIGSAQRKPRDPAKGARYSPILTVNKRILDYILRGAGHTVWCMTWSLCRTTTQLQQFFCIAAHQALLPVLSKHTTRPPAIFLWPQASARARRAPPACPRRPSTGRAGGAPDGSSTSASTSSTDEPTPWRRRRGRRRPQNQNLRYDALGGKTAALA